MLPKWRNFATSGHTADHILSPVCSHTFTQSLTHTQSFVGAHSTYFNHSLVTLLYTQSFARRLLYNLSHQCDQMLE